MLYDAALTSSFDEAGALLVPGGWLVGLAVVVALMLRGIAGPAGTR
jgi:hypothetical protein